MRTKLIAWAITFITAVTLSAGQELGKDASILKEKYVKGIESIRQDKGKKIEATRRQYMASLEELLSRVKKAGDLDRTTTVMTEIDRFRKDNIMPDKAAEIPDIRKLQIAYSKQSAQLETDTASRIVVLTGQYDKDLESLEKKLVASDKIDQAKHVREERNSVKQNQVFVMARNALSNPGKQPSISTDRAVGGNPAPVYLDDLDEIDARIGYGKLGKHGEDGAGVGRKFSIRGTTLTHSLYTHPPSDGSSSVSYSLGEDFFTLKGTVTVTDDSNPRVPLIFRIIGNNNVLWQSQPVRKAGETQEFTVSIRKMRKITLDVNCPGVNHQAGAVWQDPRVYSTEPRTKVSIVGKWTHKGTTYEFLQDGTATHSVGSTAKWRCLDEKERKYEAVWSNGAIDSLQLSEDGVTIAVSGRGNVWGTFRRLLPDLKQ